MGLFSFIQGVGRRLGLGTTANAAEAEAAAPVAAPSVDMLQQELSRLHLPFDGMTMRTEGNSAILEGTRNADAAMHEKLVLAIGNSAGIASVDDRTTAPAGAAAATASTFYTVKKGDTLSAIAKANYGDANAYMKIFEANKPMLADPDKIYPGQVLRIPAEA